MGAALSANWREVPTLCGAHATLEPLSTEHADGLRLAVAGSGLDRLWYANVPSREKIDGYIAAALTSQTQGSALPFVARDAAGDIVGSTRLYRLDPQVPTLLIGYTWYAPRVQRSGLNTECKLMLLRYAFETLGCVSVGFETSWFNHASRAAIERLGARQDGVLRNHKRHADGSLRDTVVFSILDHEWPAVRRHLQYKLEKYA